MADLPPTRQHGHLNPADRARLNARHQQLLDEIRAKDAVLAATAKERRRHLDELATIHDQLHPKTLWHRGRRPAPDRLTDPLPPLPENPTWLWGRRLRAVCLRLLHRCGTLPLRQLHALLHLHGFGVAGDHPVKTLADALGHETEHGTTQRVARGRYRTTNDYRPPPQRQPWLTAIVLPDLTDLDDGDSPSNAATAA
jgi:hypothetical protein